MLGKIFKTIIDTATLPIDVAKDIVTIGGIITEKKRPYTVKKLNQIVEDLEEIA